MVTASVVETIPDAADGTHNVGLGNRDALVDRDDEVDARLARRKGGRRGEAAGWNAGARLARSSVSAGVTKHYHWLQHFGRSVASLLIMPPEMSHGNRNLVDCGEKDLDQSLLQMVELGLFVSGQSGVHRIDFRSALCRLGNFMQFDQWPSIARSDPPPPYALVTATASDKIDALGLALRDAFQDAMAYRGRLREDEFLLSGFSGKKFRLLMNNLINYVPDPRYLEIGVYHGASFCPAIFRNRVRAVGIDNWSEYGGQRHVFDQNLAAYQTAETDVRIIEQDFRDVDYGGIGKFNVLFYDGSHDEKDQYDGIRYPQPAMEYPHVMIVDDWNWDRVRKGTFDAMRDSGLNINYSIEVRTTFDGDIPLVSGPKSEWHNGTILAVVSK